MFGRKGKGKDAAAGDELADAAPVASGADDTDDAALVAKPAPKAKGGGILMTIVGLVVVTLIGAGGGVALGTQTGAAIERAIAVREAATPVAGHPLSPAKYPSDTVLKTIEPVITNLASPSDIWVRIETAMIFKGGSLANPDVTAAQIRQDQVAYLRTLSLAQLEGPSALQHLREDLNERASLRSGGKVTELIIQTLIVQ